MVDCCWWRVEIFERLRLSEVDRGELIQLIETDAKQLEGYDKGQLQVTEANLHWGVHAATSGMETSLVHGSLIYALSEKCRLHLEGERTAMITPGLAFAHQHPRLGGGGGIKA